MSEFKSYLFREVFLTYPHLYLHLLFGPVISLNMYHLTYIILYTKLLNILHLYLDSN